MLELHQLGKRIGDNWIFRHLDRKFPAGIHGLSGPNGSGKSTLLKTIAGFYGSDEGKIQLNGLNLEDLPVHQRGIGYVPQSRALFSHLSVRQNIFYKRPATDEKINSLIDFFELSDKLDLRPPQLSQGYQSRTALLRALASAPRLLLFDEALSEIDARAKKRILPILSQYLLQLAIPVLWVSHDPDELAHFANAMHNGFHMADL